MRINRKSKDIERGNGGAKRQEKKREEGRAKEKVENGSARRNCIDDEKVENKKKTEDVKWNKHEKE